MQRMQPNQQSVCNRNCYQRSKQTLACFVVVAVVSRKREPDRSLISDFVFRQSRAPLELDFYLLITHQVVKMSKDSVEVLGLRISADT